MNSGRFGFPTFAPPAMDFLGEYVTGKAQPDIQIQSLPWGYRDIALTCRLRGTDAATSVVVRMRLNLDASALYDYVRANRFGAVTAQAGTYIEVGDACGANSPAGIRSVVLVNLSDYASPNWHKPVYSDGAIKLNSVAADNLSFQVSGVYRSYNPVSAIQLFPSASTWEQDCVVSVYGIR